MWSVIGSGLFGVGLGLLTVWAWRGRLPGSRWWIRVYLGREAALGLIPGMSLLTVTATALTICQDYVPQAHTVVAAIVAVPMVGGFVLTVISVCGCLPSWWGPQWWRDLDVTPDEIHTIT